MSLFSFDPYQSDNLDELREAAFILQQLALSLESQNESLTEMKVILKTINRKQGEKIALLTQKLTALEAMLSDSSTHLEYRQN